MTSIKNVYKFLLNLSSNNVCTALEKTQNTENQEPYDIAWSVFLFSEFNIAFAMDSEGRNYVDEEQILKEKLNFEENLFCIWIGFGCKKKMDLVQMHLTKEKHFLFLFFLKHSRV